MVQLECLGRRFSAVPGRHYNKKEQLVDVGHDVDLFFTDNLTSHEQ